jgi:hypothetical protein
MCPCALKAPGSSETPQNSDAATLCHISEDPNPQSVRCGELKSLGSLRLRIASECRMMAARGAERRAETRVLVICASNHHYRHHRIAIILSPEHYAYLCMFCRCAVWVMMEINQGVEISTERHGDSCVYR